MSRSSFIFIVLALGACDGDPAIDAGAPDAATTDSGGGDSGLPGVPLRPGPYGTSFQDTAGPFVLDTTNGPFDFEARWDGETPVIFVSFAPGDATSDQLFTSSPEFVQDGPPNAHYVFLSYSDPDSLAELEAGVEDLIDFLVASEYQESWRDHVHFVEGTTALATGTWISDFLTEHQRLAFAIDSFQRIRNVGSLAVPTAAGWSSRLANLRYEAEYFGFERVREERLSEQGATVLPGLDDVVSHGEPFPWGPAEFPNEPVYFTVTFPDAETMATFDTLEVDLAMNCTDRDDVRCNEWDRNLDLFFCPEGLETGRCSQRCEYIPTPDPDDPPENMTWSCPPKEWDNQLARWITSYHREGRWVTDISPMLPRFLDGGTFSFYLALPQADRYGQSAEGGGNESNDPFVLDLSFRLSNQGKPDRPFAIQPVVTGGHAWDADYASSYPEVAFGVPEGASRVELATIVTGHGSDGNNCAEFCNHQHWFTVNGTSAAQLEFPEAGTSRGCAEQVAMGALPNQYGTWTYGRANWCPGMDVRPVLRDVTSVTTLDSTAMNTLAYEARFRGEPYVSTDGTAQLYVSSFLVFYR